MSLANKSLTTTFWATIEKVGVLGVQFIVTMVLARLLEPSAYGTIAMVGVFMAFARVIIDCGFSNALIRKKDCNEEDYSTAFIFNVGVGILAYIIIYILAPFISDFYEMPILCSVLRILGLSLIANSLVIVQNAKLTRNLAFKKMAKYNVSSQIITGIIAIIMAFFGCGVWSLVTQSVSGSFLYFLFISYVTKWKPKRVFSIHSFKYLWNFGYKMLLSGFISVTYSNIYSILIGKFYDAKSLGLFNRGQSIAQLFPNIINSTFGKSTLPLLAQNQSEKARMSYVYREFSKLVCFISFPLIALSFVLAKPFVMFFLTEKWCGAIIYVQIFAISALTGPPGMVNLNLLQALGRSDLTLKAEIVKKSICFVVIAILFRYSPLILAIGSMFLNIFIYFVNLYYAKKALGISYSLQIRDILPYIWVSVLMASTLFFINKFIYSYLLQLIVSCIVGLLFYFFVTKMILKVEYYTKLIKVIREKSI